MQYRAYGTDSEKIKAVSMTQLSKTVIKENLLDRAEMSDAHCHLELFKNPLDTIAKAREEGIGIIITSGGTVDGNTGAIEMTNYDGVFATIGIDPSAIEDANSIDDIEMQIKANPKIIGIGEIGLDAKYTDKYGLELQKDIFREQIKIAEALEIPVVVHARSMMKHVIEIIEEFPKVRFMMHFFDGALEEAQKLAGMGHLISIPPRLSSNRKKIIKHLDISNIVVETDSPVAGHSPLDVKETLEVIAKMKDISFYDVASMVTGNLKRFFYI